MNTARVQKSPLCVGSSLAGILINPIGHAHRSLVLVRIY